METHNDNGGRVKTGLANNEVNSKCEREANVL